MILPQGGHREKMNRPNNLRPWGQKLRFRQFLWCLVIPLSIGIIYFNSPGNQFTNWDDGMIYNDMQIRDLSWKNISAIFTPQKGATYQPVRVFSYAVDYYFWGLNPLGYRITNFLFYIFTCIIVFFTLQKISSR